MAGKVLLPDRAVLFHNGQCCQLGLETRGSGKDARIVIVIDPVPPTPDQHRTFEDAVNRLGVAFGPDQFGQAQRDIARLIWNERGRMDAEVLVDMGTSQEMSLEAIQNMVRRILLCDS